MPVYTREEKTSRIALELDLFVNFRTEAYEIDWARSLTWTCWIVTKKNSLVQKWFEWLHIGVRMNIGAASIFIVILVLGLFVNKYVLSVLGFKYPTIFQVSISRYFPSSLFHLFSSCFLFSSFYSLSSSSVSPTIFQVIISCSFFSYLFTSISFFSFCSFFSSIYPLTPKTNFLSCPLPATPPLLIHPFFTRDGRPSVGCCCTKYSPLRQNQISRWRIWNYLGF